MRQSRLYYVLAIVKDGIEHYWNSVHEKWVRDREEAITFATRDKAGEYARGYWLTYWAAKGIPKIAIVQVQIETSHVVEIKTRES